LIGFAIPSIAMGFVLGLMGRARDGLLAGAGFLLFFLLIFVVIGVVVDCFGGFRVSFRLTDAGVWSFSGKGARNVANTATMIGSLAGSAATLGAGLAARAEISVFIPWKEVRKVRTREGSRYILILGEFGTKPINLYCSPDNRQEVLRVVQEKAD
jgi:hypothetical protein